MPELFGWSGDDYGCGHHRIRQPFAELEKHGYSTRHRTQAPGTLNIQRDFKFAEFPPDLIVGQRIVIPEMLAVWRRLRKYSPLIHEIDDDLFHVDSRNITAALLYSKQSVRDTLRHSTWLSDLVTVSTEPLADLMMEECQIGADKVVVVPNCVDDELFTIDRKRNDRLTVGYSGGGSHDRDFEMIRQPVRRILDRNPDVMFHSLGHDHRPVVRRPTQMRYTRWKDSIREYWRSIDFDIALGPLAHTKFNESKCVDSSMRISTDRGVLRADALEVGMRVWQDGWRRIQAVERGRSRGGLLITLREGYQLRLTPEHRMLVGSEWVAARDIRVGHRLPMQAEEFGPTTPRRVPWPADNKWTQVHAFNPDAFLGASDGPTIEITPRWARLLGAFIGDGNVGQATAIRIACDGQDADWIDLLSGDIRSIGLNARVLQNKTFDGIVTRRCSVDVSSASLLRVLAHLGLTRPRPNGRPLRVPCVPEVIWRSPRPVVAEFLAGYFEADGHPTRHGLSVVSKDEQLIRDVQRLLLLFGITSMVVGRDHRAQTGAGGIYWHCNLRRAEADVFAKEIGFRSERKQQRLAETTSRPHSNRYRPMDWSREVVSIEPCLVDPVDIEVEGHVFTLAGFVSHNSALRALEMGALGIPIVASDEPPYREVVVDGETGFLVRDMSSGPRSWEGRIRTLIQDEELRLQMGKAAKERVQARWAISSGWRAWDEAYRSVLRG